VADRSRDRRSVGADRDPRVDRLAGPRRIGSDEISDKRGQRYLIVVVDRDSGEPVWAEPGRDSTPLFRASPDPVADSAEREPA
jgi:transposase